MSGNGCAFTLVLGVKANISPYNFLILFMGKKKSLTTAHRVDDGSDERENVVHVVRKISHSPEICDMYFTYIVTSCTNICTTYGI
jgi:hypothetical protein